MKQEEKSKFFWQITTVLSLLIATIITAGYITERQSSKFVPYIVEVNKLGQSLASHIAEKASPVDSRIIKSTLAQFINNLRTVTPDTELQKRAITDVYAHLLDNTPAIKSTNLFYSTESTNPFKRAEKNIVNIDILSVLPETEKTWQVVWLEKVKTNNGDILFTIRKKAILQILIKPADESTTESDIRKNPLGIFISNYSLTDENN